MRRLIFFFIFAIVWRHEIVSKLNLDVSFSTEVTAQHIWYTDIVVSVNMHEIMTDRNIEKLHFGSENTNTSVGINKAKKTIRQIIAAVHFENN